MNLILLIIVILILIAVLPTWPYSRRWGGRPAGTVGVILVVLLLLVLFGVL